MNIVFPLIFIYAKEYITLKLAKTNMSSGHMGTVKTQIGQPNHTIWPRGYKTFFMLNSTEHEISFGLKN